jgi:hypothetical protein
VDPNSQLYGVLRAVVAAAVPMVNVEDAAAPLGFTVVGAKLQLAPLGKPEQLSATSWLKPPVGVTVMVAVADAPGATATVAGEMLTE